MRICERILCVHSRAGRAHGWKHGAPGQAKEERPPRLPAFPEAPVSPPGAAHTSLWPSSACPRPPPGRSQLLPTTQGPRPFQTHTFQIQAVDDAVPEVP